MESYPECDWCGQCECCPKHDCEKCKVSDEEIMISKHEWQKDVGYCIYCYTWCENCNQCKCEAEDTDCPNRDMKAKD